MARALRLAPPANETPLRAGGDQHTDAWGGYFQEVADRLYNATTGVIDGSDADAGQIGEYLDASFVTPVALIGAGTAVDIGTLSLTPGDWDVTGSTVFGTSLNNVFTFVAWISLTAGVLEDWGANAITTNIGTTRFGTGTRLLVGPKRYNLTATTTLYLGASAGFPAGTADARGHIGARRIR